MLLPRRTKYRKTHRGRRRGEAKGQFEVQFGDYGIKALENGWITNRQIEAARIAMTRHIKRGGPYYRVCDPSWTDPSDTSFSKRKGGRWNPPDRPGRPGFGALYLNSTISVARANARRHAQDSFGVSIEDLIAGRLPDLQHYEIASTDFVDVVTPKAIAGLGLAPTYPTQIPHPPCQGIAEDAYAAGEHGIVPLSAASPTDEELVIFDRDVPGLATKAVRQGFSDWY